jgi:hypothetical protein
MTKKRRNKKARLNSQFEEIKQRVRQVLEELKKDTQKYSTVEQMEELLGQCSRVAVGKKHLYYGVSPEIARALLRFNWKNRKVRPEKIAKQVYDILVRDKYVVMPYPVIFNEHEEGLYLHDGQHRLIAILVAALIKPLWIEYDRFYEKTQEELVRAVEAEQQGRTISDISDELKIERGQIDLVKLYVHPEMTRRRAGYLNIPYLTDLVKKYKPTLDYAESFVNQYFLYNESGKLTAIGKDYRAGGRRAVTSAFLHCEDEAGEYLAKEFFHSFLSGSGSFDEEHPITRTQEKIKDSLRLHGDRENQNPAQIQFYIRQGFRWFIDYKNTGEYPTNKNFTSKLWLEKPEATQKRLARELQSQTMINSLEISPNLELPHTTMPVVEQTGGSAELQTGA